MLSRRMMVAALATALVGHTGCASAPASSQATGVPAFQAQVIDPAISIGYGLAIGDVDGDRKDDILMADKTQIVWYRNGDWRRFVMAENLTTRDNVAIAAQDIDGDGRVEVAIGAQWNPGQTSDEAASGAIRYLIPPADRTQRWEPVTLPHEPTTHRMRWVKAANGRYSLVVLPLHGRGNAQNRGAGVKVIAYTPPADPRGQWQTVTLDESMNATHNLEVIPGADSETILVGGLQGLVRIAPRNGQWAANSAEKIPGIGTGRGIGEIRHGRVGNSDIIATIEAMHGNEVVVYSGPNYQQRTVLDSTYVEGHGLAVGDLLGIGRDQVVAGWRLPNSSQKVGIKLFVPNANGTQWTQHVIDDNQMAVEDLKIADLDGDGKEEIIAAGRASKNLIIYWNKSR